MSLANFSVNPDAKEDEGPKPFKLDWYKVEIEDVEEKATKKGDGRYVKFQLRVLQGDYAKRVVFHYMVYEHPKDDVAQRGCDALSLALSALGINRLNDTDEIYRVSGRVLDAKIETITKKGGEKEDKVRAYRAPQGVGTRTDPQAPPPSRPQSSEGSGFEDDIPF